MATKDENLCEEIERRIGWLSCKYVPADQRQVWCEFCKVEVRLEPDDIVKGSDIKHKPDCLVARLRAALKTRFMLHVSSEKKLTFMEASRFNNVNTFLTRMYQAAEELGLEIEGTITHG